MKTLPLGTHYHQRGMDTIEAQNSLDALVRRQRKQINDAIWRPVIAFILCMIWGSMLIASVCDYLGVK